MVKLCCAFFVLLACAMRCSATTLPVGPITFNNNADYDSNFKEFFTFAGIFRNASGSLEMFGSPTATSAFDMSATGGSGGSGGTGGSDLNKDLANFTISADFASTDPSGVGGGFLLRMNTSESGGYVASAHSVGTHSVTFDVGEGAGLGGAGIHIFSQNVSLSNLTLAPNTFYNFAVTITGGTFQFNFGSGAATATFTDPTVSATVGQVGIVMDTNSPAAAQYLDNFTIIPEPGAAMLTTIAAVCLVGFQVGRRPPNST